MQLKFSFIIPVYNRPDEIDELLESLSKQTYTGPFEVVIVEDGSSVPADQVVEKYGQLDISYYFKENSGPGDSRNYGMRKAKGNYFIILDSDCILPPQYLKAADKALQKKYVDCYGGPDTAHESFTVIQKAINYAMTSFLTTGGIRGGKKAVDKFQPRSFNMGLSKKAFEATGGFGRVHPGEDPDLTIRVWNQGFETMLIPEAYVFHKRRISWKKFHIQVKKFGMVRPILNLWHPETVKLTYWFPTLFVFGFLGALILATFSIFLPLALYALYYIVLFLDAFRINKNITVALLSLVAVTIQFVGYGLGFLRSTFALKVLGKEPETAFPKLFFKI